MAVAKAARNTYVALVVVLGLGVVIFANLLADRAFARARVDLTADGKYSLSPSFRNILERQDRTSQIKVTYCVSKAVPDEFETEKRDILDTLREIELASEGRMVLEIVDPKDNEELEKELARKKLSSTVRTQEEGRLTWMVLHSVLRLTYADKPTEWIPKVYRAETLEYDLANKIYTLTLDQKPIVAIQRPKPQQMLGSRVPNDPFSWLLRHPPDLAEKVDIRDIELTEGSTIPAGAKLVILVRPNDLGERARYEVIRYLAGGGRVLLISSPFKMTRDMFSTGLRVKKSPTGLEDYLAQIGIEPLPDFVCDDKNLKLPARVDPRTGEIERKALPFFVEVTSGHIYKDSPITRGLTGLVMPFPSTVKIDEQKAEAAGVSITVLARTSNLSWLEPYSDLFEPRSFDETLAGQDPELPVFLQIEGAFPFPWEGKPIPTWSGVPEAKDEAAAKKEDAKKDDPVLATMERKPDARPMLFLWTCPESFDSKYVGDQKLGRKMEGNILLLPNVVESCALGEDLINLRSKQYESRSIYGYDKKEERFLRFTVKLCLIGATALALVVGGMLYWFVRRAGQVRYEREMSQSGPSSFMP